MTIRDWLAAAAIKLASAESDSPALDAELLLMQALGTTRTQLLINPHQTMGAVQTAADALLARRAAGEPVAYLRGEKEFFGLPFTITPEVLIPRPESEGLVETALELLPPGSTATVADLGTGSGCLAIAVARHRPTVRLIATDVSPAALAVAAGNARRHGLLSRIGFRLGAGLDSLGPEERVDLLIANLPYLPSADAASPALRFEPRTALDGGPDGLDHYRKLLAAIKDRRFAPPRLLWEIDPRQRAAVARLAFDAGYSGNFKLDLAGRARVAILTK